MTPRFSKPTTGHAVGLSLAIVISFKAMPHLANAVAVAVTQLWHLLCLHVRCSDVVGEACRGLLALVVGTAIRIRGRAACALVDDLHSTSEGPTFKEG